MRDGPAIAFKPQAIAPALLSWYDVHQRQLPWRALPGTRPDPYRVWLSEIMLQQTVVATGKPYFARFVERWPDVHVLAAAPLDDVLGQWAGLGYYARARNLHKCAIEVVARFGGMFPAKLDDLLSLPGIGHYTAGAIAAIAYDIPALAMDGNVERVTARLARIEQPLPQARPILSRIAASLVPQQRAGDFAQAMMDIGATVCVPATPRCPSCPLEKLCLAHAAGDPGRLPLKLPKPQKPTRYGVAYWIVNPAGAILVRRRPESGLLGGMLEVPSSEWVVDVSQDPATLPLEAKWQTLPGTIRHTFTHFHLQLQAMAARIEAAPPVDHFWLHPDDFDGSALPSVMLKVARHAESYFDRSTGLLRRDPQPNLL